MNKLLFIFLFFWIDLFANESFDIPSQAMEPEKVFYMFKGIPYRSDGVLNKEAEFTKFANRNQNFSTPGLNCSGLVVSAFRYITGNNIKLDNAIKDINQDSESTDWDYGYDLILTLSKGYDRRVIMPYNKKSFIKNSTGSTLRGFEIGDISAWEDIFKKMKTNKLYMFTISKPVKKTKDYMFLFHHVGLIALDKEKNVLICHATRKSGIYVGNLKNKKILKHFIESYKNTKYGLRKILIIEVSI